MCVGVDGDGLVCVDAWVWMSGCVDECVSVCFVQHTTHSLHPPSRNEPAFLWASAWALGQFNLKAKIAEILRKFQVLHHARVNNQARVHVSATQAVVRR